MPRQLVFGPLLIALFWTISWSERGPLAHHSFFPLWLGYILTMDRIVFLRTSTSPISRGVVRFAGLFAASVPLWWIFEAFNARLGNWSYQLPHRYSWFAYHAEASLAFSTVVPALFVTAEFYRSFRQFDRFDNYTKLAPEHHGWIAFSVAGVVMLGLTLAWPEIFFPLVWIGLFFLIDPIVHLIGGRSIAAQVERAAWSTVAVLFCAGLTCGFFWEMWNSHAMPKWRYSIPYAEFAHIFEMPLLGYGGYLPFALETYTVTMLVNRLLGNPWPAAYTVFDRPKVPTAP